MQITLSFITFDDMRFHAHHGVLEQERLTGGDFTVSLRVGVPLTAAVKSDNVADTVNYATLYDIVRTEMLQPSCLLEHVAGRIAERVFTTFQQVETVDITITKVNPPMGGDTGGASVELHINSN